jgi:hypothetical protein
LLGEQSLCEQSLGDSMGLGMGMGAGPAVGPSYSFLYSPDPADITRDLSAMSIGMSPNSSGSHDHHVQQLHIAQGDGGGDVAPQDMSVVRWPSPLRGTDGGGHVHLHPHHHAQERSPGAELNCYNTTADFDSLMGMGIGTEMGLGMRMGTDPTADSSHISKSSCDPLDLDRAVEVEATIPFPSTGGFGPSCGMLLGLMSPEHHDMSGVEHGGGGQSTDGAGGYGFRPHHNSSPMAMAGEDLSYVGGGMDGFGTGEMGVGVMGMHGPALSPPNLSSTLPLEPAEELVRSLERVGPTEPVAHVGSVQATAVAAGVMHTPGAGGRRGKAYRGLLADALLTRKKTKPRRGSSSSRKRDGSLAGGREETEETEEEEHRRGHMPAYNDFKIIKRISRGAYGNVLLVQKRHTGNVSWAVPTAGGGGGGDDEEGGACTCVALLAGDGWGAIDWDRVDQIGATTAVVGGFPLVAATPGAPGAPGATAPGAPSAGAGGGVGGLSGGGSIAVLERGECASSVGTQALEAERAGACAVVVVNSTRRLLPERLVGNDDASQVTVPVYVNECGFAGGPSYPFELERNRNPFATP